MAAARGKKFVDKLIGVVDATDGGYRINSEIGADKNGLRVAVADAADAGIALHFVGDACEFCSERRIFYIMNVALKAFFFVDRRHAAAACAEMRMIVNSEKDVKNNISS